MFLALLSPACYPFPKNLNLPYLAAEPKMMDFTIYMWTSEYNLSQAHTEVLWPGFPLHCCCGLLGCPCLGKSSSYFIRAVLREASCHCPCHCPRGSPVPVPGTAAWGMLVSIEPETKQMGKSARSSGRITSPYVFFRKSMVSLSLYDLQAEQSCLLLPDPSCRGFGRSQRFSKDTFIRTRHKKGFPKYTVNSLVHHGAAKVCTF